MSSRSFKSTSPLAECDGMSGEHFQIHLCTLFVGQIRISYPSAPSIRAKRESMRSTSRQDVTAIYDHVTPSLVRRCIACQIEIQALDLVNISLPPKWSHAIRLIDASWRCTHLRVEETRRDHVYSCKLSPLPRKALAKMVHRGFCRVVDLSMLVEVVGMTEGMQHTGWSTGTLTICAEILEVMIRLPNPCRLNIAPAYLAQ